MDPLKMLDMANMFARKYGHRFQMHLDEAESECVMAILRASKHFDPNYGTNPLNYFDRACYLELLRYNRKVKVWKRNATACRNTEAVYDTHCNDWDELLWMWLGEDYTMMEIAIIKDLTIHMVRQHLYAEIYRLQGKAPEYYTKTRLKRPKMNSEGFRYRCPQLTEHPKCKRNTTRWRSNASA